MRRLIALIAFAAGYVVGAAAGRERYEQIRRLALRVKEDPRVQEKAHQAVHAFTHLPGEHETEADAEPGPFHATTRF